MARNNQSSSNRGSSQSQPMMSGWMDTARERPLAAAAAVGGAVAAGVFLWSRRNQISDQLSNMSDQIGEWSENMRSGQQDQNMQSSGRSSTPLGAETGQSGMASAGSSGTSSSTRATGGRSGKAQAGETMSPSRSSTPTPTM